MRPPDASGAPEAPGRLHRRLGGWGRYPRHDCRVLEPADPEAAAAAVAAAPGALIARGGGRSYGDSALNPRLTLSTRRLDRMLGFDPATGILAAEAGVVLGDVIAAFLPRGWFPAVTPGTKFATLGGLIAADIHGKNHHGAGAFGAQVAWLELAGPDGRVRRIGPSEEPALFAATVGGMGLTGVILRAAIRLRPVRTAWIRQRTVAAADLDAAIDAFAAAAGATYSVAWIDCLARGAARGRSLLLLGEHAEPDELAPAARAAPLVAPRRTGPGVPLEFPSWALNRASVSVFNALYYGAGRRAAARGARLVDWDSYFYPLDAIADWNRIYGRRGLVQFQCVLPEAAARAGLLALLEAISETGLGSFLAVLKKFGPGGGGMLSFPTEGWTLALDFPATPAALWLVERLDRIAIDHGGRFYLAKDARMSRASFALSEPRAEAFRAFRREIGADRRFASAQSERLGL